MQSLNPDVNRQHQSHEKYVVKQANTTDHGKERQQPQRRTHVYSQLARTATSCSGKQSRSLFLYFSVSLRLMLGTTMHLNTLSNNLVQIISLKSGWQQEGVSRYSIASYDTSGKAVTLLACSKNVNTDPPISLVHGIILRQTTRNENKSSMQTSPSC